VLAVEKGGVGGADEELGAVCVWARVGHREGAWAAVSEVEVLILKLGPVDGLPAGPILVRKVAALAHEARDHAVERRVGVAKALLAGAERAEVFRRLGYRSTEEAHLDAARGLAADGHVKVDGDSHVGVRRSLLWHHILQKVKLHDRRAPRTRRARAKLQAVRDCHEAEEADEAGAAH